MKYRVTFITGVLLVSLAASNLYAQTNVKESEQLDFAQGLLSRGMYDMAIQQYQKFITDYPHSPSLQEAYLSLGEGYFLSQEFDKAIGIFDQFKSMYPNSDQLPISILRLGQIDIQQQKYDDALKDLTSGDISKLKGPMLQSFDFYIGRAYLGKPDTASALSFFQKAVQVDGSTQYTADAYDQIGQLMVQAGKYDEALDAYTKGLAAAGDDLKAELTDRIAETQFLAGKFTDAIDGFKKVVAQYPGADFAKNAMANLLLSYFNLGQYDQLLKEYDQDAKLIKNDPTDFQSHLTAVLAYIELKDFDKANALLDRMLAWNTLKPQQTARIFIKKADILIRQKKYADAQSLLQAYAPQNIDDADENLFLEAQCYFGLGDFDRAFNQFENVYLNFSNSRFASAALLGQAHARKQTGRFKEAEVLFKKYADTQNDASLKSEALYDAIMMALKAGETQKVIDSSNEYLKAFPDSADYAKVLLLLADAMGKNNQSQQAIDLLQGYAAKPNIQRPNAAYFLLGFNEQSSGQGDKALAAYAQVDPNKEEGQFYDAALKNMAIIYLSQKKEDQARIYFDRLMSLGSQNDLGVKTYAWVCNQYLKEQKYNDVLRVAEEAEKHFQPPDLQQIRYFEAEALRGLGRCDDAIKDYDQLTSSTEKNSFTGSAHIGHGLCLATASKFDQARVEFQKSLDENAEDYTITAHARFEMANMDAAQANYDEAIKYYLLVATIYDDDYYCSQSLLKAGKIFEQLKRKEDALKMYAEILEKYKNSTAAVDAKERIGSLK